MKNELEEMIREFPPQQRSELRELRERSHTEEQIEAFIDLVHIHIFEQGTDDQRSFSDLVR